MPFVPILIPTEDPGVRDTQCRLVLQSFDPGKATVAQRRDYAQCVYRLDGSGEPMPPEVAIALKVLIVVAVVGALCGAWKGWQEDGIADAFLYSMMGAMTFAFGACFLVGAVLGLGWVFGVFGVL